MASRNKRSIRAEATLILQSCPSARTFGKRQQSFLERTFITLSRRLTSCVLHKCRESNRANLSRSTTVLYGLIAHIYAF